NSDLSDDILVCLDLRLCELIFIFFFQAEDGIRDWSVTGVQTCALPILIPPDREGQRVGPRDRRGAAPSRRGGSADLSAGRCARRSEERRVGKECRSRWARCD